MSTFNHNKWIKNFKSRKFLNEVREPKSWDTQFAMKAIEAYESGDIDISNPASVKKWDKEFNGGTPPNPAFETAEIITYAIEIGKKPDGSKLKDTESVGSMKRLKGWNLDEAPQSEFGIEDAPDLQTELQSYIEEVERVADEVRDLEQFVAGGIDRYEDETGDLRITQLRNQASRYIQSSEKNLDGLYKALQRAQKGNA